MIECFIDLLSDLYLCLYLRIVKCTHCHCKKMFIDVISLCVSFRLLILIQLCTKFVERGRGVYVR